MKIINRHSIHCYLLHGELVNLLFKIFKLFIPSMHLPKTIGTISHTSYQQNVYEDGYMGSFILHSLEEMSWRDPSLKIACTKFSFFSYIAKFFFDYTGSSLHRHRSRLSIMISFHVTPTRDIFKSLHCNLKR